MRRHFLFYLTGCATAALYGLSQLKLMYMPKISSNTCLLLLTVLVAFQSCVKDRCTQTYSYFSPVYKTSEAVRANIKSNEPKTLERTGKLYIRGNYIFLNEVDKGIHVINNTNPANPVNVAFIDIPGNMDMAVKGNMLYADAYTDLMTIDITDPLKAKLLSVTENAFPYRQYYGAFYADTSMVIVDWVKRDTTIDMDCGNGGFFGIELNKKEAFMYNDVLAYTNASGSAQNFSSSASVSPFGVGGSMARFTIVENYLYAVTLSNLNVFSIAAPQNPSFNNTKAIGMNIETIYPFKNKLFIGSTSGMFIYDISNGGDPVKQGSFAHVASCDPVIADDAYAYVTLRSGNSCNGFTNQMEVLDIADVNNPSLVKIYPMTNPFGLSKDGNLLFICDGADGLKIYDAADVNNIKLITTVGGFTAYDVIARNGVALVVSTDGLHQYSYSNVNDVQLLSKIQIAK